LIGIAILIGLFAGLPTFYVLKIISRTGIFDDLGDWISSLKPNRSYKSIPAYIPVPVAIEEATPFLEMEEDEYFEDSEIFLLGGTIFPNPPADASLN